MDKINLKLKKFAGEYLLPISIPVVMVVTPIAAEFSTPRQIIGDYVVRTKDAGFLIHKNHEYMIGTTMWTTDSYGKISKKTDCIGSVRPPIFNCVEQEITSQDQERMTGLLAKLK